ncbi:MAG: sugar phosphate nucleotidyltransferase [Syntrophobacteraceae bacterium]|jgi:NDP-sugar pyrophosphorylase family protein
MKAKLLPVAILSGGLATRLRPLTGTIPKALVEVQGEPFVSHQLRLLERRGIERVVICAGYLGEMIRDFVGNGDSFGVEVEFVFDGDRLLGTGGAIRKALPRLGDSFFVLYGDSYLTCDYAAVQASFRESAKLALMTVFFNNGQWDTSNVEFIDGKILDYDKKKLTPRMRYIDYGLGVFQASAFEPIPDGEPYDLYELYKLLLLKGDLAAFEVGERFYEVGSLGGIEELSRYLEQSVELIDKH